MRPLLIALLLASCAQPRPRVRVGGPLAAGPCALDPVRRPDLPRCADVWREWNERTTVEVVRCADASGDPVPCALTSADLDPPYGVGACWPMCGDAP